jgi:membrane associated rhomboid family serine protease
VTDSPSAAEEPRCYRHPDRVTYVRCQRCGRYICGQCQTPAAVGVHCPECMREARASVASTQRVFTRTGRILSSRERPIVTYAIIALAVIGYILQVLTGQGLGLLSGSGSGPVTQALWYYPGAIFSHPWALITVVFVHQSILHIASNMYFLFLIGPPLERYFGRVRFIVLFVITALGADVAVDYFLHGPVVGASGAIFGLLGVAVVFARRVGFARGQLWVVIAINLALGFAVTGIAWQAHVGGFIIGILLGFLLRFTQNRRRAAIQIAGFVVVGLALIATLYLHAFI